MPSVPYARGRGGITLGGNFHEVMEQLDMESEDPEDLDRLCHYIAAENGQPTLAADVLRLVQRLLRDPFWERVRRSERIWREVTFAVPWQGDILEGALDLAFMEEGALIIADYKTDRAEDSVLENRRALYVNQMALYALAAGQVLSFPVKGAYLLFVQKDEMVFDAGEGETLIRSGRELLQRLR